MKVTIGIPLTFNLEINLQKHGLEQNMTLFLAAIVSFFRMGMCVRTYATTKELKKKVFMTKCENIKQPVDIQLTFMLESKIEKYVF